MQNSLSVRGIIHITVSWKLCKIKTNFRFGEEPREQIEWAGSNGVELKVVLSEFWKIVLMCLSGEMI